VFREVVEYPRPDLHRSRDPRGAILTGVSHVLHARVGDRYPRRQESDGLVLGSSLYELRSDARDRSLVSDASLIWARNLSARLVYLDDASGELTAVYPDVRLDADRRRRASRVLEAGLFPLAPALESVETWLERAEEDRKFGARLARAAAVRFWRVRRSTEKDECWEAADAAARQWLPLVVADLQALAGGLRRSLAQGASEALLLGHQLT